LVLMLCPSPAQAEYVGFLRDASGAFTTVVVAGSVETTLFALNNAGQSAGYYYDASLHQHGFVRDSTGSITTFDVPGSIGTGIEVRSLNGSGVVAGDFLNSTSNTLGFVRDTAGAITTFAVPGSFDTGVSGLNNLGELAGNYATGALPKCGQAAVR
jgi:predicted membrane protein